ncbi:hypothetical protein E4M02_02480 [Brevundimonas sp. S30B]|uniref:hypothetical protein n=1 Tax=unclassified Brevundimonas TaxID=2622653 RepID=UPI001072896C|nr:MULTISPECIES: hypothetical protein [unclassified Brevundimonas]QBX37243.1 hypothetical protein E4M01_05340 [Brevundimonas sp. MF30-B]TFW03964.1 hypothetical protein E4M02_02480 [Brevundimonas sp. S30B]
MSPVFWLARLIERKRLVSAANAVLGDDDAHDREVERLSDLALAIEREIIAADPAEPCAQAAQLQLALWHWAEGAPVEPRLQALLGALAAELVLTPVPLHPHVVEDLQKQSADDLCAGVAMAVLLSLREPSEAMQNAGVDFASSAFDGWVDEGKVTKLFAAMIDAAIAEGRAPSLAFDRGETIRLMQAEPAVRRAVDWLADETAAAERGKISTRKARKGQAKNEATNRIMAAVLPKGDPA